MSKYDSYESDPRLRAALSQLPPPDPRRPVRQVVEVYKKKLAEELSQGYGLEGATHTAAAEALSAMVLLGINRPVVIGQLCIDPRIIDWDM